MGVMREYPNWGPVIFVGTRWSVRRSDAYYVSKAGNDATNNGSPRAPYQTIGRAIAEYDNTIIHPGNPPRAINVVVSSGTYAEYATPDALVSNIIGDGLVTCEGFGAAWFCGTVTTLQGLVIQNYRAVFFGGNRAGALINCRVRQVGMYANGSYYGSYEMTGCLFEDSFLLPDRSRVGGGFVRRCTFVRSHCDFGFGAVSWEATFCNFRDNTFGPGTIVNVNPQTDYFDYNNMQGQFVSRKLGIDAPMSLAQWKASYPGKSDNCIQTVEQFNSPSTGNYTLAQTSPIRNASTEGSFLGAYGVGIDFGGVNDAESLINARWDAGQGEFAPVNPALPMSVEFVTKDTGRVWVLQNSYVTGIEDNIDHQTIDATYSFENVGGVPTDTPSGQIQAGKPYWVTGYDTVSYNGITYANDTFIYGVAGATTYDSAGVGKVVLITETPNIRLMELKYSSTSQGDCDSRSYKLFMVNRAPTYNTSGGRSNGDALFNHEAQEPLSARWLKVKLTILPNTIA